MIFTYCASSQAPPYQILNQSCSVQLLEVALSDAEGLASSVHETSSLSERVSKKVRELDLVQSRAQESVARINRLVSRTKAISGVLFWLPS